MSLKLFNTLSRKKETFKPIVKKRVGIYSCGPTVYQFAHIGNLRSYVMADILHRTLEYAGMRVAHVVNITDVGHLTSDEDLGEDKIEAEAKREHKTAQEIAAFYTDAFLRDLKSLNVKTAGVKFPRASKYIKEQITLIKKLEKKGLTYRTGDGIYFDTSKIKNYGKLARLHIKELRAGARIGMHREKRNPADFALWKFSPKKGVRQQEWKSPWGVGFPGWHIECSAMAMKYLGKHFDIHTGGIDHIPVHHTNEIAQSEGATGKKYVNYWIHNEFVKTGAEKMAKSAANILTLEDLQKQGVSPLAYRYWLLTAHYSTPISFTWDAVYGAEKALERLIASLAGIPSGKGKTVSSYIKKFSQYINDNLDTPRAIALVWELLKDNDVSPQDKRATIFEFDRVLGLDLKKLVSRSQQKLRTAIPENIHTLVSEREAARARKDWAAADSIRRKIQELGYEIKDTDQGPHIEKRGIR
jgi:cysteinyl-tRNA synthetase